MVQWSLAIVLTPSGWIGRIDFHVPQTKTLKLDVQPAIFSPEVIAEAQALITPELKAFSEELLEEFYILEKAHRPAYHQTEDTRPWWRNWLPEPALASDDPVCHVEYECGCTEYLEESEIGD